MKKTKTIRVFIEKEDAADNDSPMFSLMDHEGGDVEIPQALFSEFVATDRRYLDLTRRISKIYDRHNGITENVRVGMCRLGGELGLVQCQSGGTEIPRILFDRYMRNIHSRDLLIANIRQFFNSGVCNMTVGAEPAESLQDG